MSAEENKAIIRRVFEEGLNQRRLDLFDALLAPTYVNHNMPAPTPGPAGFKAVIGMFLSAFPDISITVEDVLAEGDRVATRGTFRGTHQGEFMGVPPTGKAVAVSYIDLWRLEGGRAVENWVQMDLLGLMQQLGAIPAPGQGGQ
jgi:steroid delta-isomerase-like uncharacterized protein